MKSLFDIYKKSCSLNCPYKIPHDVIKKGEISKSEKRKPLNKTLKTRVYSLKVKPSEMASLSDFRWQNTRNVQIDPQSTEIWTKWLNVS